MFTSQTQAHGTTFPHNPPSAHATLLRLQLRKGIAEWHGNLPAMLRISLQAGYSQLISPIEVLYQTISRWIRIRTFYPIILTVCATIHPWQELIQKQHLNLASYGLWLIRSFTHSWWPCSLIVPNFPWENLRSVKLCSVAQIVSCIRLKNAIRGPLLSQLNNSWK